MSSIERFFHYNKQYVVEETKNRIHSTIRKRNDLTSETLLDILNEYEMYFDAVLTKRIHSLNMKELKNALGKRPESIVKRPIMINELVHSHEKDTFKQLCLQELNEYVSLLQNKSKEVILKENKRRKTEEERKALYEENKRIIISRMEQGDKQIDEAMWRYATYFVADVFLHVKKDSLYHDFKTVEDFLLHQQNRHFHQIYVEELKESCFKKWISIGITLIEEEKGDDIFRGTYPNHPTPYYMLKEHLQNNEAINTHINRFVETIGKEDFKTIFQEGINHNPKLYELWKKERVRRLVGKHKKAD